MNAKIYNMGPLFVIIAAVLWSTDALFRYPLTQQISPTLIVFGEHLLGALLFVPFLWRGMASLSRLSLREWLAFLFISIGGSVIATLAFTAAFSHVSPSVAILLQKTQPLIAITLATLVLRERLPKNFLLWAGVALVGAYVVSFPELTPQLSIYEGGTIGIIYALIASFFWGGSTVFGRIVLRKVPYQQVAALRLGAGAVTLFALLAWQGNMGMIGDVTAGQLLKLIWIVLVPGAVALLIYYRGLLKTKASVATIVELVFPFSAVIINWVFLDQKLVPLQIVGGIVLLVAITRITVLNKRINEPVPVDTKAVASQPVNQ